MSNTKIHIDYLDDTYLLLPKRIGVINMIDGTLIDFEDIKLPTTFVEEVQNQLQRQFTHINKFDPGIWEIWKLQK